VLDREHHMGYPVAHALQALQRPGQGLPPPVAKRRTAHRAGPGRAAGGDARRVGGNFGLFTPFGGQDLQVDGDLTRRQEEGVRVPTHSETPELAGVGSQEGLVDGTEAVDENGLRIGVV
jgi:hypothetical protein